MPSDLQENLIETTLTPINQQGIPNSQPSGQITELINGVVEKFDQQGKPGLRAQKRNGFQCLPSEVRSATDGSLIGSVGFTDNADLFSSFSDQLVTIAGQRPHVFAEQAQSWSRYDYIISPKTYRYAGVYGGNRNIKNPQSAAIGGVRAYAWSEEFAPGLSTGQSAKIMFVDDNGTPIALPRNLASSSAACRAKVVSDGTYFWVVWSQTTSVIVKIFDSNGIEIDSAAFETLDTENAPWDLTYCQGYVLYCQTSALSARVTKLTRPSGSIVATTTQFGANLYGDVGCAWAENATSDGFAYLLTAKIYSGFDVRAFRIGTLSATPTASFYYGSGGQTSGGGVIYSQDGEGGIDSSNATHCELTGIFLGSSGGTLGLRVQVSFLSCSGFDPTAGDHRLDRTVFLTCPTTTATVNVDGVVRGVRCASRPFSTGNGRYGLLMYYPSAIPYTQTNLTTNAPTKVVQGTPTYFQFDIHSLQMTGRFFDGIAGNEWSRWQLVNSTLYHGPMLFCLPSVTVDHSGNLRIPLGVNGESVTTAQVAQVGGTFGSAGGKFYYNPTIIETNSIASSVSICDLVIGGYGQACEYSDEMFLPGALSTLFDGQKFSEQGIFPPEQITIGTPTTGGSLTLLGKYSYIDVLEYTNAAGKRVRSAASVPVDVTLTGTSTSVPLSGPVQHMTNVSNLSHSIYRSSGTTDPTYRKITNDNSPILNDTGNLMWSFVDNVSDVQASVGEVLYSGAYGQGYVPRDPMPPFSSACVFDNRIFFIGPDGSIGFTCEESELYPLWWNVDTHRFRMPTNDPPIRLERLDTRLIIFCQSSIWWMSSGQWPDGSGLNGNIQTPVELPFGMGCTGFTEVINKGVAFSSSAGGIWVLTRSLQIQQLTEGVADEFKDISTNAFAPVVGIALDKDQRVSVAINGSNHVQMVWDQVASVWGKWTQTLPIILTHVYGGKLAFCTGGLIHVQREGVYTDDSGGPGTPSWFTFSVTAAFNMFSFKGLQRIWRFLVSGMRRAAHKTTVNALYVTEDSEYSESWTFETPAGERFENDFQPKIEEMQSLELTLYDSPPGGAQDGILGDSFAVDMVSFEAGTDGSLTKTPASTRRRQST